MQTPSIVTYQGFEMARFRLSLSWVIFPSKRARWAAVQLIYDVRSSGRLCRLSPAMILEIRSLGEAQVTCNPDDAKDLAELLDTIERVV